MNGEIVKDLKGNNKYKTETIKISKMAKFINKIYPPYIFAFLLIILIMQAFLNYPLNNNFANITLKIKGKGSRTLFGYKKGFTFDTNYYPNKININGIGQPEVKYSYEFDEEINVVELIWDSNDIDSCRNLFRSNNYMTEIDLNNFDISKVTSMWCMFRECSSLTTLNLTKLDTSKLKEMNGLFIDCTSLTSINLSNFYTSECVKMESIFIGCKNLEYINIENFNSSTYEEFHSIFEQVPENVVICIKEDYYNDKILDQIKSKACYNIDCSWDWRLKQKKLIDKENKCINSCSNDSQYIYEYSGKCYDNCLININEKSLNICECELEQCLFCANEVAIQKGLCTKCNYNYYPKENDPLNIDEYINCYKEIKEYYLDNNEGLFKKCYETCDSCEIGGDVINHNCLICKPYYKFKTIKNNYLNCYNNCSFYYYFDNNSIYCTNNYSCPEGHDKLIENKMECTNSCSYDNNYIYGFRKRCYKVCPEGSIKPENDSIRNIFYCKPICSEKTPYEIISTQECVEKCSIKDITNNLCIFNYKNNEKEESNNQEKKEEEEIKAQDIMLHSLEEDFTSGDYDTSNLDKGEEEVIKNEKMVITLTTTENQKNSSSNNNMTQIDLGHCETLLRNEYKIKDEEYLYMKKYDIKQEGMKIPKVEYDVYRKINGSILQKLNLSICQDTKISLSVPVILTENLDILNSSSGYYNDIC